MIFELRYQIIIPIPRQVEIVTRSVVIAMKGQNAAVKRVKPVYKEPRDTRGE